MGLERREKDFVEIKTAAAAGREGYVEERVDKSARRPGKVRRRAAHRRAGPIQISLFGSEEQSLKL